MSKLLQKFGKKATQETAVTNSIDYEQLIVSFVKNEISYDQIMEVIHTDDAFLDYVEMITRGKLFRGEDDGREEIARRLRGESSPNMIEHCCLLYDMFYFAIRDDHPEFVHRYPNEEFLDLLAKCVPDYMGFEAELFAEDLLLNNEEVKALPKTKKIKYCKEKLREYFHIEGRHYPHWVQDAQWPFRDGKPMRFVGQKTDGELVTYTFVDDETGEVETVEQCW